MPWVPRFGYKHCGDRVAINPLGDLIVHLSPFEYSLLHRRGRAGVGGGGPGQGVAPPARGAVRHPVPAPATTVHPPPTPAAQGPLCRRPPDRGLLHVNGLRAQGAGKPLQGSHLILLLLLLVLLLLPRAVEARPRPRAVCPTPVPHPPTAAVHPLKVPASGRGGRAAAVRRAGRGCCTPAAQRGRRWVGGGAGGALQQPRSRSSSVALPPCPSSPAPLPPPRAPSCPATAPAPGSAAQAPPPHTASPPIQVFKLTPARPPPRSRRLAGPAWRGARARGAGA